MTATSEKQSKSKKLCYLSTNGRSIRSKVFKQEFETKKSKDLINSVGRVQTDEVFKGKRVVVLPFLTYTLCLHSLDTKHYDKIEKRNR